jgi:2-methylisocitrate lyase-like PEP mutase family enzyme
VDDRYREQRDQQGSCGLEPCRDQDRALWKRVAKATSWAKVAVSNGMFGETKKCAVRATTPTTLLAELATLGVARISYGSLLHHDAMRHFTSVLTSLTGDPVAGRH